MEIALLRKGHQMFTHWLPGTSKYASKIHPCTKITKHSYTHEKGNIHKMIFLNETYRNLLRPKWRTLVFKEATVRFICMYQEISCVHCYKNHVISLVEFFRSIGSVSFGKSKCWMDGCHRRQNSRKHGDLLLCSSLVSNLWFPGFGSFKPIFRISEIKNGLRNLFIGVHHKWTYGRKRHSESSGWR